MSTYELNKTPRNLWPRKFRDTRWTLIRRAADGEESEVHKALDELYRSYWFPVFAEIRPRFDAEVAAELTETVFLNMLARNELRNVNGDRGSFRCWLKANAKNVVKNHRRYLRAKKRDHRITDSFDVVAAERRYQSDVGHERHPQAVFDRRFALCFLTKCLKKLEAGYRSAGNGALFDGLVPFLQGQQDSDDSYRRLAATLNMTEGAVNQASNRMRREYRKIIEGELANIVVDPAEAKAELGEIREALRLREHDVEHDVEQEAELDSEAETGDDVEADAEDRDDA